MPEPFVTTVVGSMPKPAWLYQQQPLAGPGTDHHGSGADWNFDGELLVQAQDDATRLAIHAQESAGLDIISDGEQRRKSYLTYIANRLEGFDYDTLAEKWIRDGRRLAQVGRCVGPVGWPGPLAVDDLQFFSAEASRPVKMTLPGPMTIVDSTFDAHYGNEADFAVAVAEVLNREARELDRLNPAVIQFDEPVFSRYPEKVADWGIEALDRCVAGLNANTAVHVCYSYPMPGIDRPIKPSYPINSRRAWSDRRSISSPWNSRPHSSIRPCWNSARPRPSYLAASTTALRKRKTPSTSPPACLPPPATTTRRCCRPPQTVASCPSVRRLPEPSSLPLPPALASLASVSSHLAGHGSADSLPLTICYPA